LKWLNKFLLTVLSVCPRWSYDSLSLQPTPDCPTY